MKLPLKIRLYGPAIKMCAWVIYYYLFCVDCGSSKSKVTISSIRQGVMERAFADFMILVSATD